MRAITERELAFALNCLSIDNTMSTPDFELAEKLVSKVFENRGTHPSLTGNPVEPKIIVSIQMAGTLKEGDSFQVLPEAEDRHTHWSIYVRYHDFTVKSLRDFPRIHGSAYDLACRECVRLSGQYNVPIEMIP